MIEQVSFALRVADGQSSDQRLQVSRALREARFLFGIGGRSDAIVHLVEGPFRVEAAGGEEICIHLLHE